MNISELRDIIAQIHTSDTNVLELRRPGFRLRLEMQCGPAPATQAGTQISALPATSSSATLPVSVPAPCFGIFTTRHPSREAAFCQNGQHVNMGDMLALLRIDELYVPVISHIAGQVRQLVEEGCLTGYATPLFEITPKQVHI